MERKARRGSGATKASGRVCEIEKIAAEAIFDFDDPKIDIEVDFAFKPRFNGAGIEPFFFMKPGKKAHAVINFARRCWAKQSGLSIKPVDLYEYGAGFRRAPSA